MSVITVTKNNYVNEVMESDRPVLIDLWATWCGPCQMMSPVIEEMAEAHPEIKVCKINVDEEPELSQLFRVSSIPMLVVVKDGKVANSSVGFKPMEQVEKLL